MRATLKIPSVRVCAFIRASPNGKRKKRLQRQKQHGILQAFSPRSWTVGTIQAAQVSGKWLRICKSDRTLRRTVRLYQRRTTREIREGISEYRAQEQRVGQRKKTHSMRKSLRLSLVPRFEAMVVSRSHMRGPPKASNMRPSLDVRPVRCMRL
ncbi:uncharacterized protein LOC113464558 [Ceratina calcarata]|uniref:Uncharacterized protein LOC113464558 n=1 Tax=Ceratina calcarata TaxID=156304 RepID=A0AAJ7S4S2_9HYME|nr:uncharacterized protein LOC113464558 [Ceratina calcarata]